MRAFLRKHLKLTASLLISAFCLISCKKTSYSAEVKLAGGVRDSYGRFSSVVGVGQGPIKDPNFVTPACTATALSASVLLTAAHCFFKDPRAPVWLVDNEFHVLTDDRGALITGVAVLNEAYGASGADAEHINFKNDLALVRMPVNVFGSAMRLSDFPPRPGDQVTLVGFGFDYDDSDHPAVGRQWGTNRIHDIIDRSTPHPEGGQFPESTWTMIWLIGNPTRGERARISNAGVGASTVPGDSGGPLLLNGQVVGTLNGGGPFVKTDPARPNSVFTNIFEPTNVTFLHRAVAAGWDLGF